MSSQRKAMSPEGEVILFYASNLYLQGAYAEAQSVVEDIAIDIKTDEWLKANSLKLLGLLIEREGENQKAAKWFDEARKLFRKLKSEEGEAACNLAYGYVKTKNMSQNRVIKAVVLRDAKIRIQEALDVFKGSSHYPGLAIGTRLLL